ncbi:hypothetical protein HDU80_006031 [Chytriomyces hyalinus]|nr:hypothetical protein HDU80_006020 [Chytriomyces hyalinus]KAJ3408358.1 hypothetical protein HDU80_006031 [Chytriomyces hyalinus]
MGVVFTGMGLASVLFPETALRLFLADDAYTSILAKGGKTVIPAARIIFQCFGSQAALCGTLILTSEFTAATFKTFGLAMIPYFLFDYWAWKHNFVSTLGAVGDGLGNIVFAGASYLGYKALTRDGASP